MMNNIADQFINQYLHDYDFKYCGSNLKISPFFQIDVQKLIRELEENVKNKDATGLLPTVIYSISGGILSNIAYDYLKSKYHELRIRRVNEQKTLRPIHIIGEDKEKTILDFGSVRPFFKVGGKNVIILENLTIRYSGSSSDFFDIEEAPGIILINIDFIQKKINSS